MNGPSLHTYFTMLFLHLLLIRWVLWQTGSGSKRYSLAGWFCLHWFIFFLAFPILHSWSSPHFFFMVSMLLQRRELPKHGSPIWRIHMIRRQRSVFIHPVKVSVHYWRVLLHRYFH